MRGEKRGHPPPGSKQKERERAGKRRLRGFGRSRHENYRAFCTTSIWLRPLSRCRGEQARYKGETLFVNKSIIGGVGSVAESRLVQKDYLLTPIYFVAIVTLFFI